jgi:serine/threonine protein kinase
MSPEQAAGNSRRVGPASDVYSLGTILYELLTGQPAFRADTFVETIRLVSTVDPVRPRTLRGDVPRDLEAICLKCLEKDPGQCYSSAFELASDLRRFLANRPTKARPIKTSERIVRWCRRKPSLAALIAVSIAAPVILLLNILSSNRQLAESLSDANKERQREGTMKKSLGDTSRWQQTALTRPTSFVAMHVVPQFRIDTVLSNWSSHPLRLIHSRNRLVGQSGLLTRFQTIVLFQDCIQRQFVTLNTVPRLLTSSRSRSFMASTSANCRVVIALRTSTRILN